MATSDVTALQRSDLNEFLFAEIGMEANGMTLSVVSVFARQGRDPWGEAGRLAELPKAEATDSLARSIAAMPRGLWDLPAAGVIALRLIGLLPARPALAMSGIGRVAGRWSPTVRTVVIQASIALAVVIVVAVSMQRAPSPRLDGGDVATFTSVPPAPADNVTKGKH